MRKGQQNHVPWSRDSTQGNHAKTTTTGLQLLCLEFSGPPISANTMCASRRRPSGVVDGESGIVPHKTILLIKYPGDSVSKSF